MKRIILSPFFLILLTSCSAVDNYKNDLKEELKTELKSEITVSLREELDRNNKYEIKILDDTLLGVSNFEIEQPSYGGCKVGGNFKFNIKVPKDFTGDISDTEAIYLFKGKEKMDSYYESFLEGKSLNGTYIYNYESSPTTTDGQLICSINSSDDIKLKSFSEKIIIFPAIKPSIKWNAYYSH